jgi:hypothetical protein
MARTLQLPLLLAGAALTVIAAYAAVHLGLKVGAGAVLVAAVFLGSVVAYLRVPHIALAITIPLFAFVPALKVFVTPSIGGVKDVIDLAAICAMVILVAFERRRTDPWVTGCVLLLLALYLINPGHGHNTAWAQGVRLTGEPLLLLLVGLMLPGPRRNFRYACVALVATGCVVALYGLFQQLVGPAKLVSWGYAYSAQVRTAGSLLRSFGTLDDPFDYSVFLLYAAGIVFFRYRRGGVVWSSAALLLLGVLVSFVRTVALIIVGFLGMQMIRWRKLVPAAFLVAAALVVSTATLAGSSGSATTQVTIYTAGGGTQVVNAPVHPAGTSVLLNGRISAWTAALGSNPLDWIFGRGVGKVGTAAARAQYTIASSANQAASGQAVDSGYLATVADVGLLGLLVELVLFGRLLVLSAGHARARSDTGWATLSLLVALLLYALTRAAFTGFPTAFLGLLLVGLGLAAADDEARARVR